MVKDRDHTNPPGSAQGLPGRHWPPGDDPSLLLSLLSFLPGLPERFLESLLSCPHLLGAFFAHCGVPPVGETQILGESRGAHNSPWPSAGSAGKALASGKEPKPPPRPSYFLSPGCLNVLLKSWHPVPVPRGPSCSFVVPPFGKTRTLGSTQGLHDPLGPGTGAARKALPSGG